MRPGVDLVRHPRGATELVLLAHGGQEHSHADPDLWRPALLRMWPFAVVARRALPAAAVGFMRYRYRGWNDTADPATDLRAVLDELPYERVHLIGHSMGGRAVVAAGDHPRVAGVLGLAPWLPAGEPLTALKPPVTFVHGTADTVTDPRTTVAYAKRLQAAGTPVTTHLLPGDGHAMLQRTAAWDSLVADFLTATESAVPERTNSMAAGVREIASARFRMPVRERFRVS
ncbi:alpha/beta fold hydrolase [Kribbella sp. NPDC026611]|uniref:alpha/beta hydrolase n=1 Tax=Kribbella sp. NPDC026611 TaxID=3154911 RepID=UPI0033FB69EC